MPKANRSKKGKRPDKRPARGKYWRTGTPRKRKVAHLMQHNGFSSKREALEFWLKARTRYAGDSYAGRAVL